MYAIKTTHPYVMRAQETEHFIDSKPKMTKENHALHSDLNQVRFQIELRVYNKIRMCNKSQQNGLSHLQCNISIFSNMIQYDQRKFSCYTSDIGPFGQNKIEKRRVDRVVKSRAE